MSTETQTVDTQQQAQTVDASQFLPGAERVAQVTDNKVIDHPAKEQVAPTETQEVKAEVTDPYELAIEQSMQADKPLELDDAFKATFKTLYGHDDPLAYKEQLTKDQSEAQLVKAEYEKMLPLKQQMDALPPALKRAYQLALEGKTQEAQDFLRELPSGVFLNKAAKDVPAAQLIDTYLPGKMSKEDRATMNDPDSDPAVVEALKTKEKHFLDIASDMHERKRQEVGETVQAAQREQQAANDRYIKGVAEAISLAKNDPLLKAHVDESMMQDFQSGKWLRNFLQEDGFTPTPEAVRMLVRAKHHDQMMKAQYNVGYRRGKNEGTLEAVSGKPGAPPTGERRGAVAQQPADAQSAADQILGRLGMR